MSLGAVVAGLGEAARGLPYVMAGRDARDAEAARQREEQRRYMQQIQERRQAREDELAEGDALADYRQSQLELRREENEAAAAHRDRTHQLSRDRLEEETRRFNLDREDAAAAAARAAAAGPAQDPGPRASVNDIRSLQNDWMETVGTLDELRRQQATMHAGMDQSLEGNTAAGSQAVLVTFQKILDPTSVVRESEYARSGYSSSYINQAIGFLERAIKGGAGVPVAELQEYVNAADAIVASIEEARRPFIESERQRLTTVAEHAGAPPELIFGSSTWGLPGYDGGSGRGSPPVETDPARAPMASAGQMSDQDLLSLGLDLGDAGGETASAPRFDSDMGGGTRAPLGGAPSRFDLSSLLPQGPRPEADRPSSPMSASPPPDRPRPASPTEPALGAAWDNLTSRGDSIYQDRGMTPGSPLGRRGSFPAPARPPTSSRPMPGTARGTEPFALLPGGGVIRRPERHPFGT